MLKSPLMLKGMALLGCMALLLIPLRILSVVIGDRADYRDHVTHSLEQSTSGPQKLVGPLIAIPVTEITTTMEEGKEVTQERSFIRYWLPESLVVTGKQAVEPRHVGIYEGQVWRSDVSLEARFTPPAQAMKPDAHYRLGDARLVMAVGDSRGIGTVGALNINGQTLAVEPGTGLDEGGEGLHANVPAALLEAPTLAVRFSLELNGTGAFSVVPLGRSSEMSLISNWPHPNFYGNFLPASREISASGFAAKWRSSWYANNLDGYFQKGEDVRLSSLPAFSVTVATPVDQYQLTDRAVKYAMLLIALTYMAFFVCETLSGITMHPVQYLLVGLSLVMFYLLLLAFSEHIGFNLAWLVASLAGATLNALYLQAVLKGWRRSLVFAGGLLALDGVLWQLLRSQDFALLLGSGLLFAALTAVMLLTRHIDWYALTPAKARFTRLTPAPQEERFRLWK
ncbi:cell envelope integrity protein CreD [Cronobacter dublinensis]